MAQEENKLTNLLDTVIEHYITKWDPVGSKFLHTIGADYAPSTLRKYLNLLEKEWLVYQAYNSSGRIPTVEWLKLYVEHLMETWSNAIVPASQYDFDVQKTRTWLRFIVETLSTYVDGIVTWYLANDEYYFLGINKLMSWDAMTQPELLKHIIWFVEEKKIIWFVSSKPLKNWQIYHSFIDEWDKVMSVMYVKLPISGYDWVFAIIWPVRVNYKNNLTALQQFISAYMKNV